MEKLLESRRWAEELNGVFHNLAVSKAHWSAVLAKEREKLRPDEATVEQAQRVLAKVAQEEDRRRMLAERKADSMTTLNQRNLVGTRARCAAT